MEQTVQKRGYLLEEFRLFHLNDPQGTEVEYHYHDFHKILILLSGQGTYAIEGQRYALQPGDVVVLGSGTVHRPEFGSGMPYERMILYFSPDFLRFFSQESDILSMLEEHSGFVVRTAEPKRRLLLEQFEQMEKELAGGECGNRLIVQSCILRLLAELGRIRFGLEDTHPEKQLPKDEKIRNVLQFIGAHLTEPLDVERLARSCFLSKYYFMRRFKEELGVSVHRYILEQRLMLAKSLLDNGKNATEACYGSGFRSYSAFSRDFASLFGSTPTGRRNSLPGKDEI